MTSVFQPNSVNAESPIHIPHELNTTLRSQRPSEVAIVSDMTGTILQQVEGGYSPRQQTLVKRLLEDSGLFVLATNDSTGTAVHHFLTPLEKVSCGQNVYLITGGGSEGYQLSENGIEPAFTGKTIPAPSRGLLLDRYEAAIAEVTGVEIPLFSEKLKGLFCTPDGLRLNISEISPHFGKHSYLEIIQGKAAVFFLDDQEATPFQQRIFDRLMDDPAVREVVERDSLQIIRGANYLDVVSATKGDGLSKLFHNPERQKILEGRTVLVCGDSSNDEALFLHQFPSAERVINIYLGENDQFAHRMRHASDDSKKQFFFLRSAYTMGTEKIFTLLLQD